MASRVSTARDEKGRPLTYDMIKQGKKRPVRRVVIPLDDELAEKWQSAQGRVEFAKLRLSTGIDSNEVKKQVLQEQADAQKEMDSLKKDMEGNVAVFKIQGLGRRRYSDMQEDPKFQPTPEQKRLARERHGTDQNITWNTDTFPPVLIHACLIEPKMTLEEVQEMWDSDEWTTAELLNLLQAAIDVNEQLRTINWGKG